MSTATDRGWFDTVASLTRTRELGCQSVPSFNKPKQVHTPERLQSRDELVNHSLRPFLFLGPSLLARALVYTFFASFPLAFGRHTFSVVHISPVGFVYKI